MQDVEYAVLGVARFEINLFVADLLLILGFLVSETTAIGTNQKMVRP